MGEVEYDGGWADCSDCGGSRFGEEILSVRLSGLNVADVLSLSVAQLLSHPLASEAGWCPLLEQLVALDLGYLTLGRRLDRVSGGEHQRLRIAQTLASRNPEGLFLVLDEPSAGLHPRDVERFLSVVDRVVGGGANTVLLVEHNLDLIRASDWVIDFGPGGGPEGGRIVGQGPPNEIAKLNTPTGRVLASKLEPVSSSDHTSARPTSKKGKVDPRASTGVARQWLRRLIGEDALAENLHTEAVADLAATFDPVAAAARPHEIGGLDIEIGRLALDQEDNFSQDLQSLAEVWAEDPDAYLQIHPFLEEIRVWGSRLPVSVVRTAQDRIGRLGLVAGRGTLKQQDLPSFRATGSRFQLVTETMSERVHRVRDALTVGGGYVELSNSKGCVLGAISRRHFDLVSSIPAVAPLVTGSASLSRSHAAGRCPCCRGMGSVQVIDERLLVSKPDADPLEESFLSREALGVLRGVRRNIFLPFFKQMIAEGLWFQGCPYFRLSADDRDILMHGYWHRPGHGSFLKKSGAKPDDIRSWLRWDGLMPIAGRV